MKKVFKIVFTLLIVISALMPFSALAKSVYYTNSSGIKVHVPVRVQVAPIGASAQCKDYTYSFSTHRRGTCSGHRGVLKWL